MKLYVTTHEVDVGPNVLLPGTIVGTTGDQDFSDVDGILVQRFEGVGGPINIPSDLLVEYAAGAAADNSRLKAENAKLDRITADLVNACLGAARNIESALAVMHLQIHDSSMLGRDAMDRAVVALKDSHADIHKAVNKTDLIPF